MSDSTATPVKKSFKEALLNRRMLACLLTGFASGLPLYLLIQFVPAWLRESEVDLKTIGLFSLAMFPYTWKFLWAPVMDRYVPPVLGRRRGWMLITQSALVLLMLALAFQSPSENLDLIIPIIACIAFFGASQDIVIDAYRRELLPEDELGAGNAFFTQAYRLASFVPGSLALILSGFFSWTIAHLSIAVFMAAMILVTFWLDETSKPGQEPPNFKAAVVEPFKDFFTRQSVSSALLVLVFIFLYKLGDNMATALETPFFLDMGFTPIEIGSIAKIAKTTSAALGTIVGGVVMVKLGINKSLWIFGFFQIFSILGYAALSVVGHNYTMLTIAAGLEYFGVGLGTVALLAYMSRETNTHFSATQFALFSSLASLPRTAASASTGFIIESVGYTIFFFICFALAIPGMLLLFKIAPWNGEDKASS